ncbi:VOC family protein [Minwuia sp. IMCC4030]|jgi:catechol 2,3-dioxygenase-like lactoylglutathione lyase family enzyme|uniref:VOC family protein n=1 Tax=Minwuia sp. IMCC4030 TaxID=3040677 RepID=UPI00247A8F98|nr:VOC family protein [Minwuia sp. IMCC4030]
MSAQGARQVFSHIFIGINDFEGAFGFYQPLAVALGLNLRFSDAEKGWAAWNRGEGFRPLLVIGRPFDGKPATPGNGQMTAFLAESRAIVDECHRLALVHGGTSEGEPGLRPHYHPDYYGAYFRDPEGNKLCVVCDAPETSA